MRIQDLQVEARGDRVRASARIHWEDCERDSDVSFIETTEEYADGLTADPHAFLAGCLVPALHFGERRITVDGEVCPEFLNGLEVISGWLWLWYYQGKRDPIRIEACTGTVIPRRPARAAVFFSGGIDSLATLRRNRLRFPPEHPGSIRDGLCVLGLEQTDPQRFGFVLERLAPIAADAGIRLVPVFTNVYSAYRDQDARQHFKLWALQFQGAAFAAIGHAFSPRLSAVYVAASDAIPDLVQVKQRHIPPYGTHPLIDSLYGSAALRVFHDGIQLSRLDKVRLIADWPVALENLRVCNQFKEYQPGRLNCGQCEKCIRTMLELLVLGKLGETHAFPFEQVTAEMIERAVRLTPRSGEYDVEGNYRELLAPLRREGRRDLAAAIEGRLRAASARRFLHHFRPSGTG